MTTGDSGGEEILTLYRLHGCPYCERVVTRLDEYGVPYRSRFVPPEHSRRDVVERVGGTRSVPLLVDVRTGVTMAESANIVEYVDRTYGDGDGDGDGDGGSGGERGAT